MNEHVNAYRVQCEYVRAHVSLSTPDEAMEFVRMLKQNGGRFVIENFDSSIRVSALSILGVMYMMMEFPNQMYVVNTCGHDLPGCLDSFRVQATA